MNKNVVIGIVAVTSFIGGMAFSKFMINVALKEYLSNSNTNGKRVFCTPVIFNTRDEAEHVLTEIQNTIDAYGVVSLSDFNDLIGFAGSFTDNKYGWSDLSNASIRKVKNGYSINLPKTIILE